MKITELFVCEKPDQGKNLAKALDWNGGHKGNYIINGSKAITWGIGHLLSQAPPEVYQPKIKEGWKLNILPIVPDTWIMQPPVNSGKSAGLYKQLGEVGKLIKEAQHIVIATDYDREGETIAWEMMDYYGYKGTTSRMIFGALDKKTLVEAYKNKVDGSKTYGMYLAGLCRMRADWLMGMNITMALTASNNKFLFKRDVLSAGRVQSPIIHLVVGREKEIKNFKPIDHYDFTGTFITKNNEHYDGKIKLNKSLCNENGLLTNKETADSIIKTVKGKQAVIFDCKTDSKETVAPLGYDLDELQKEGINRFGYTSQQVLDIAQKLYETYKIASYPRTDSRHMPVSQLKDAASIMNAISNNMQNEEFSNIISLANPKLKTAIWNDKKVVAHHAIIPINNNYNINQLNKDEKNIYDLVCRRYIMQFLGNYKYESTKIKTKVNEYIFESSGNVPKVQGWKIASKGGDSEKENLLPQLKKDDEVTSRNVKLNSKKTKPPAHYTEATILSDMANVQKYIVNPKLKKIIKKGGIGTPATRSSHMENLFNKNYLKRDGKKIRPTDKAMAIDNILPDELKLPETTAYWEEALNLIVEGKLTLEKFMSQQNSILNKIVDKIKKQECQLTEPVSGTKGKIYTCDKCKSLTQQVKSEKTKKLFWVCGNDDCNTFYKDSRGKRGEIIIRVEQPAQPNGDFPCLKCNKHQMILRKSSAGNLFWVCTDNKCGTFANDNNGKPVLEKKEQCHKCLQKTLVRRKKKEKEEYFWVCSDKKCGTFANDENGKPVADLTSDCPSCKKNSMVQRKKKSDGSKFWVCNIKQCGTFANDVNGKPYIKS